MVAQTGLERKRVDPALRALDVALAGLALIALSPLLGAIALATRLGSGTPVFHRAPRVGRTGHIFMALKFRTLEPNADTRLGAYRGNERALLTTTEVTKLGRALRASGLDGMPQLLNVLKGDLSLVGPLAVRPAFFKAVSQRSAESWQRLAIRPGLTCPAQLRADGEIAWSLRLEDDVEYAEHRSIGLYLQVLFASASHALRGAWHERRRAA